MTLVEKHALQQKLFRQFAETEFTKELQDELDVTGVFNWEIHKKMEKYGFMGVKILREYGGQGADYLTYALMIEELARVGSVLSIYANTFNSLGGGPLMLAGSEEQKRKYLPPVASGEKILVFALTEPGACSDAGGIATTAVPAEDGVRAQRPEMLYFLSPHGGLGHRLRRSGAGGEGYLDVYCGHEAPRRILRLPREEDGHHTSDVVLEDVHVPRDCLVGPLYRGFAYTMKTLDGGCGGRPGAGVSRSRAEGPEPGRRQGLLHRQILCR